MDLSVTHQVSDLAVNDRQSIEHLVGAPLSAPQKVCIVVFTRGEEPDVETRSKAAAVIEQTLDEAATYARGQKVTEVEIDEAVDEAMRAVRRRNTP